MCDCIKLTHENGKLVREYHTRLCVTVPLEPGAVSRVILRTENTFDAPKRNKPVTLIASYCPFCGKKYQDETKIEDEAQP
jgi:hypothetical protein